DDRGDQPVVNVIATEVSVAVCREHLKNPIFKFQNGDIEGAASKIINRNNCLVPFVNAICKRRCSRLIHDPQYIQTRHVPSVLCGLSLSVIEVCRNSDHSLKDLFAKETRCSLF